MNPENANLQAETKELLDETESTLRQYVWYPSEHHYTVVVLFLATTWSRYPTAPYLALHSPEPQCGKTVTLDILNALVRNPFQTGNTTVASLFRAGGVVEKDAVFPDGWPTPRTWLLDEIGRFLSNKERADELIGILNVGYRDGPGSLVVRQVKGKGDWEESRFYSYGPKVLTSLQSLENFHDLLSRTIVLELASSPASVELEVVLPAFLGEELMPLRDKWVAISESLTASVERAEYVSGMKAVARWLASGRMAETWTPLLHVAGLAGGAWAQRGRDAAESLRKGRFTTGLMEHQQLLRDAWEIRQGMGDTFISTYELIDRLVDYGDERPWLAKWGNYLDRVSVAKFMYAKPARQLADLFANYTGVKPKQVRIGERRERGYDLEELRPHVESFQSDMLSYPRESVTLESPVTDGFVTDTPESDSGLSQQRNASTSTVTSVTGVTGVQTIEESDDVNPRNLTETMIAEKRLKLFTCPGCGHERTVFDVDLTHLDCYECGQFKYVQDFSFKLPESELALAA